MNLTEPKWADEGDLPSPGWVYAVVIQQKRDGGKRYMIPNVQCRTVSDLKKRIEELDPAADPALRERFLTELELDAPTTHIELVQRGGSESRKVLYVIKEGVDRRTPNLPYVLGNDKIFDVDMDAHEGDYCFVRLPPGTTHVRAVSRRRPEFSSTYHLGYTVPDCGRDWVLVSTKGQEDALSATTEDKK